MDLSEIFTKYALRLGDEKTVYLKEAVGESLLKFSKSFYAHNLNYDDVELFISAQPKIKSVWGLIFTKYKLYYCDSISEKGYIWYDDIDTMRIINCGKCDSKNHLIIQVRGKKDPIAITTSRINKTPLKQLLEELKRYSEEPYKYDLKKRAMSNNTIYSATSQAAFNYEQVNTLYDEEKFHASQGHGFAAERANDYVDRLQRKKTEILGDDNSLNGPDRLVREDGKDVLIQSKYCQSGSKCIDACFDKEGRFRYYNKDGSVMQIEVPYDKYEAAVKRMSDKIEEGKIKGITDPSKAKEIVRRGYFSYATVKHIAKAGTIESITYDAATGAINATPAMGLSAAITFAYSLWTGDDFDTALKKSSVVGLKVGLIAIATSVAVGQASKAGLNRALVGVSNEVVKRMGSRAASVLVNAYRSGSNIYGAAALRSAAKLLRGNAIVASISFTLLTSVEAVALFRGRISGKQFLKNSIVTGSSIAIGALGGIGTGALVGTVFPGVGNVAGVVGGGIIGAGGGVGVKFILDKVIEDDGDEMIDVLQENFTSLVEEYLLTMKEADRVADGLSYAISNPAVLKEMYSSVNRNSYARSLLCPMVEEQIKARKRVSLPSFDEACFGLDQVLSEDELLIE